MILVTGGAGLIGSTLVWTLNQMGHSDIIIVDHLGTGEKWKNLRALNYRDYFEKDDFYKMLVSKELPCHFDVIFHLGACSDTTETDATYLCHNNFEYSKALAIYAMKRGIKMIYASSAATYGDREEGFEDDNDDMFNLRPLNKYGYSKLQFDQWLYNRGYFSPTVSSAAQFFGLKYSNVFGPNEYHKAHMRSVVLRAFEQITESGKVQLFKSYRPEYADGEQVRDFLYVKDAAAMTAFFMLPSCKARSGVYNIGYGSTRSWNDLANAVFKALGREPNIEYIDMPESLRPRYQYYTCLNISKLRNAGYTLPLYSLEEAAADYVKYLLNSQYWGDRIATSPALLLNKNTKRK